MQRGQIIQRKEEAARQAVWGEAGVIIAELKLTVEALRKQLGQEQVAKAQLEEDMKQAFMRGVCALNLEVRLQVLYMLYVCYVKANKLVQDEKQSICVLMLKVKL